LPAYFNFDMVGRIAGQQAHRPAAARVRGARVIEQANVSAGFDLQVQLIPYQPTNVASFNQAGVPCLNFFTGTHVD